jgi:hypothetical protein
MQNRTPFPEYRPTQYRQVPVSHLTVKRPYIDLIATFATNYLPSVSFCLPKCP